jgi:hypothetical protein
MAVTSEAIRLVADREESGVIEKISRALGITADECDSQLGIIIVYYHRVSDVLVLRLDLLEAKRV